ncbi:MAG: hypothetical protein CMJ37_04075 [Phycisphaerae bacterium]|nr:hypothetical protein [Phycisphaerae bacterium]
MRRALTLMEMLVALALILALTVAVGSFADTYRQGRDFAVSEARRDREVDAMFGRLAEAFSCADASVGGISGDEGAVSIHHRGSVLPAMDSESKLADLLADSVRYQIQFNEEIQEIFTARSSKNTLTWRSRVSIVQLRYHDGSSWTDSWSVGQGLPVAIECKLWYEFDPEPETIETAEGAIEADVPTLDESEWPRPDRHRIFAPVDPSISTGALP